MIGTHPSPTSERSVRSGSETRCTGPTTRTSSRSSHSATSTKARGVPSSAPVTPRPTPTRMRPHTSRPAASADDRDADRAVGAQPLQRAALQREQHPQHAGGRDGRGRPRHVAHPDERGERLAQEHRGRRHGHQGDEQLARPGAQRRAQDLGVAEAVERRLARGRQLHGLPRDEQDQEGRDERGQRAVVRLAEQAREDDGEDELDRVVAQRGGGEPRRLAGVRARQRRRADPERSAAIAPSMTVSVPWAVESHV